MNKLQFFLYSSLLLFLFQCSKDAAKDPLSLNGVYEGKIIYNQTRHENPCGINGCANSVRKFSETYDYELRIAGLEYWDALTYGQVRVVGQDSILFTQLENYCPPTADCIHYLPDFPIVYSQNEDTLKMNYDFVYQKDRFEFTVNYDFLLVKK